MSTTKQAEAMQQRLRGFHEKSEALKVEFDLAERDLGVPQRTVRLAKVSIDYATALVNGKPQLKNQLDPKDLQRIIDLVKDLCKGKTKYLMLTLNEDKSGVLNINTQKQYFFK